MTDFNPDEFNRLHFEHEVWTEDVVPAFRALGLEPNDPKHDRLFRAIEYWGEWLAHLRAVQSTEVCEHALDDKADRLYKIAPRKP